MGNSLPQISAALRSHYTPPKPGASLYKGKALQSMLRALPSKTDVEHVDPILTQIKRYHPYTSLLENDYAVIAFLDDCVGQILRQTDLDYKIEVFVRKIAPLIASIVVHRNVKVMTKPHQILTFLDILISECVGWSEDLGTLGEQFIGKTEVIVSELVSGRKNLDKSMLRLHEFFAIERARNSRLELGICGEELKVLKGQKGKFFAANLLNEEMIGKRLPLFMIFLLQGTWNEFLEQVFLHHGQKSQTWKRAKQLTRSLIWSIQPQREARKQATAFKELPGQIARFASQLKFDTTSIEQSLNDVIEEHRAIRKRLPSSPSGFDLLEVDASLLSDGRVMNPKAYRQVKLLQKGQWFSYDDKTEPDEKVARIKLLLNWKDTDRLLFTNQNRRKIRHMSYHEIAGHISHRTLKSLNPRKKVFDIINSHLALVMANVEIQREKKLRAKKEKQQLLIAKRYLLSRQQYRHNARTQDKKLAQYKRARTLMLKKKASRKLKIATKAVRSLKVNAWVKLPIMINVLTPCQLVKIVGNNYQFANRSGIMVAEYSVSKLSQMIVTENSEILDTGAEFERSLPNIVTGFRPSRRITNLELSRHSAR